VILMNPNDRLLVVGQFHSKYSTPWTQQHRRRQAVEIICRVRGKWLAAAFFIWARPSPKKTATRTQQSVAKLGPFSILANWPLMLSRAGYAPTGRW
jgi:hypothetical protein